MPASAIVPGAPLERPARNTPLRSFSGIVPVPPDRVFADLVRRLAPQGPEGGSISSDPARGLVVVQGGWWYRGEWRVLPDGTGTRLEHEIVNVAPTAHWAGPLAGRAVLAGAASAFDRLLADLARVA